MTIWIRVGGGGGGGGYNTALALHTQTWLTSGRTMNQLVCDNVTDAAPLICTD